MDKEIVKIVLDFDTEMDSMVAELTKKYSISKSKLLNSGGGSGPELAGRIKLLKKEFKNFDELFARYIK